MPEKILAPTSHQDRFLEMDVFQIILLYISQLYGIIRKTTVNTKAICRTRVVSASKWMASPIHPNCRSIAPTEVRLNFKKLTTN